MPNYTQQERDDLDALYLARVKEEEDKGNLFYTVSFSEKMQICGKYFRDKEQNKSFNLLEDLTDINLNEETN